MKYIFFKSIYILNKYKDLILLKYWTNYFKKRCSKFGKRVIVKGRIIITGSGNINCGSDLLIRSTRINPVKIYIASKAKLTFGDKVFLNNGINISCSNQIEIGTHVDIADECMIMDNDFHGVGNKAPKSKPIIIEDDVWIASRVIILKGVRIGRGSVVGAGAVVTKSIPPNSFAAGNPARVIRPIE